jgi:hypothetical protein
MDFGDGVQQLLVSDIIQRDYLRVGVDQAGSGPRARDREVRFVRDLPPSAGVVMGNSIHIEEAENLTNVWIHDNIVHNSMDLSGAKNMTVENNVVSGAIVLNGDLDLVVRNNTITATDSNCPDQGCCPGMIFVLSAQRALLDSNTLTTSANCKPAGVVLMGNIVTEGFPFLRDVTVSNNIFKGGFDPLFQGKPLPAAVVMSGVDGVVLRGNRFNGGTFGGQTAGNVCQCCQYGHAKTQCVNVTVDDMEGTMKVQAGPAPRTGVTARSLTTAVMRETAALQSPEQLSPEQLHLAYGVLHSSMRVAWSTLAAGERADAATAARSVVQWGFAPGSFGKSAPGLATPFTVDAGRNWTQHTAEMIGLPPRQRVWYRVGSEAGGWSTEHSFTAR